MGRHRPHGASGVLLLWRGEGRARWARFGFRECGTSMIAALSLGSCLIEPGMIARGREARGGQPPPRQTPRSPRSFACKNEACPARVVCGERFSGHLSSAKVIWRAPRCPIFIDHLTVVNHSTVLQHKLTINAAINSTSHRAFRQLLREIQQLLHTRWTRGLPIDDQRIDTPNCSDGRADAGWQKKPGADSILRAGNGFDGWGA